MTKLASALLLLALVAAPTAAAAQNPNPLTANAKVQFGALSGFVVRSAEKVPEGLYNFRADGGGAHHGSALRPRRRCDVRDVLDGRRHQAAAHGHREGVTAKPVLVAALKEGVSPIATASTTA